MKIPNNFKLNTEDFKVYFDNNKKTYIAENIETGEKTNIGVLGVLMQMGILKAVDEREEKKIESILERLKRLEERVDGMTKETEFEKEQKEEIREETEEEKKSEIKERIINNVLKQAEEESKEKKPKKEEKEENEPIIVESDEEIENWMKI